MFTEVFEFCICVVVTAVQLFYILSAIKGIEQSGVANEIFVFAVMFLAVSRTLTEEAEWHKAMSHCVKHLYQLTYMIAWCIVFSASVVFLLMICVGALQNGLQV